MSSLRRALKTMKRVPPDEPKRAVLGCMADKIQIVGDVESPVLPPIQRWDMYRRAWAADLTRPRKSGADGHGRQSPPP